MIIGKSGDFNDYSALCIYIQNKIRMTATISSKSLKSRRAWRVCKGHLTIFEKLYRVPPCDMGVMGIILKIHSLCFRTMTYPFHFNRMY